MIQEYYIMDVLLCMEINGLQINGWNGWPITKSILAQSLKNTIQSSISIKVWKEENDGNINFIQINYKTINVHGTYIFKLLKSDEYINNDIWLVQINFSVVYMALSRFFWLEMLDNSWFYLHFVLLNQSVSFYINSLVFKMPIIWCISVTSVWYNLWIE